MSVRSLQAKVTKDPFYLRASSGRGRADGRTVQEQRRRDLVAIYLEAIGGRAAASELALVQIRKAAELTCAAEAMRARVLAGDPAVSVDALVKLEGEARRAVRALGIKSGAPAKGPGLAEYLAADRSV